MRKCSRSFQTADLGKKDLGWYGVSMVGPELGRETDTIAKSACTIERRL